ncbi:3-phosphoshikimate 1-carboxyvinyltransferase [Flavobacterium zepuense]|uniref:3-phosphoshikimate 1-carboxyvinyltransferase n=1 Tax=Flavobacterium zepuense TaxID=2593302 RepID=A0A552V493_9FLAO|nr:3-phosphoshikimate 1-carboxyvinyltransferase [Flavobacterium zepuense]TRW25272.1 3-phosphoshikimate 1-carboxyvinyltransferase [Flavobacterium zepuense]
MNIKITVNKPVLSTAIRITGSKSETNRLLLLQALYPGITIHNISESDDSAVMQQALANTNADVIDIHHAGTAMRFLTAYFSLQEGREVTLTGSQRMKERPIAVLVDALRSLGAQIEYTENEGFPPIKITGKNLSGGKVYIKADVSSQYITALLLIAGRLKNGLELTLQGELTSIPYIKMTLGLLSELGIEATFEGNVITVKSQISNHKFQKDASESEFLNLKSEITVESDWSSASYFYSIVALAEVGTAIVLSSYKQNSLQGDSALAEIYKEMGVETTFKGNTITLKKLNHQPTTINRELNNTPDIAQTIAVTCFGLGIGCHLTGLHTLKIKETDRLEALKTELGKFGAKISVTNDSLTLEPHSFFSLTPALSKGEGEGLSEAGISPMEGMGEAEAIAVATYNDHRMAMAFAPLAIKTPFIINDAQVVSKSYPTFWDDMKALGFSVNEL